MIKGINKEEGCKQRDNQEKGSKQRDDRKDVSNEMISRERSKEKRSN